ncbi:MAG: Hsp20/alpha crystallin family protein [Alphaproteobacteria bacterium]
MTSQASEKNIPVSVKQGASPIQAFQKEVNNLFRDFFGETLPHLWRSSEACMPFGACPATDVVETDKAFKIMAELPGMEAKDITVTISDNYVTIKGEKREETKEEKNGYFRQERSYGEFQRVIALPPDFVNIEKAEAQVSKGILTISLPKKAGAQSTTRKLDVKQAA